MSDAAKNASATQRVEQLAHSKQYNDLPVKPDSFWDYSEWASDIPSAALNCTAHERVLELAMSKKVHKDYDGPRPVMWMVSNGAKAAIPSIRVQHLARPKSRSHYKEDYDPNWCKVPVSAKQACASQRIEELSLPIPRKVTQKRLGSVKS